MAVFHENDYPAIRNGRILLRRLEDEDVPAVMNIFDQPLSEEKARQMVSSCDQAWRSGTEQVLGIVSAYDGHVKGFIELYMHEGTSVMTGYRTAPAWRHLGYGKDAVYTLVHWLAENTEIETVYAAVEKDNDDSLAIVRHNGFELKEEKENLMLFAWHKDKRARSVEPVPAGRKEIYCAGGCFWGAEKAFRLLDGVTETMTGYANGVTDHPSYEDVCRGDTGYKETVRIIYDPSVVSLATIMKAFFLCIDPTVKNRQGNDIGSQYQTGVYFTDEKDGEILQEIFTEEKKKYDQWYVELEPLRNFYGAEEYHQNYLDKHVNGYCHITKIEMDKVRALNERTKG